MNIWISIIVAGLINYLTRLGSVIIINPKKMNNITKQVLNYVPSAVFPAIIFPAVFLNQEGSLVEINDPKVIAIFIAFSIGILSRNLIITIFLEEINKDYVRTARAKGLSDAMVMYSHVLRNALIPILTGVVVVLPSLFLGSLITEAFFGIPGLGSYTIEAIQSQDFAIVRSMVFLGSVLYILGLILTDISYTIADPRVRLD